MLLSTAVVALALPISTRAGAAGLEPTPAAITLTPDCGAPLQPSALPGTYAIRVIGVNFDPFTQVLVTFDAGDGGRPESFQAVTDGFGRFTADIAPAQRPFGDYLVRADDFRLREATATFSARCPPPGVTLLLVPAVGPPGLVVRATGTGFPGSEPVVLAWDRGVLNVQAGPARTQPDGTFAVSLLIMHHDVRGVRQLTATVQPGGTGAAVSASAGFLVVPGTEQPAGFVVRR
jgi:hypothetical protein